MDQKDPHIQRLLSLLPEGSLHPGFVVCRCVLKDCLPIDKSFLDWIEAHPVEKLCGEYAPFHGSRLMPYRPTAPTAPPKATHITEPNGIPPHKQLAYSSKPW